MRDEDKTEFEFDEETMRRVEERIKEGVAAIEPLIVQVRKELFKKCVPPTIHIHLILSMIAKHEHCEYETPWFDICKEMILSVKDLTKPYEKPEDSQLH